MSLFQRCHSFDCWMNGCQLRIRNISNAKHNCFVILNLLQHPIPSPSIQVTMVFFFPYMVDKNKFGYHFTGLKELFRVIPCCMAPVDKPS